ncbi:uncharacterized protein K452DRAFT_274870 [Aplosporella prunicola CBS 121167]|uniref:A to I editase domain-containing protein n=1 Tax=Aplosporella prunicola CBS 121167 TaxID=1176127 RepID=A0A6A6B6M1_9PEZI|nr:uncharacterized protein K452DRAFT_274870 [Aplosporella prunicola CBS 121167]KAF2139526.1 hypothetical protein K452DRAFT_274870 [Aplosporella prunicola CBS 121167]
MPADDDVAECVLRAFDALPPKRKPRARDAASREWVPLAGVVLANMASMPADTGALTCAALGTGMKCLPASRIPAANGVVLHDWHAEVLAIRAFNRFLIDECAGLLSGRESEFVRLREQHELSLTSFQPFAVRDHVRIYMYCSEAPCGDASMELTMEAQEDATPWALPPKAAVEAAVAEDAQVLRGRGYFSELGIVRRKPARPDAPPTLSKSCTDKLAMKQCTSLLTGISSILVNPQTAYLHTLILPESQHVPTATTRAFGASGRMSGLTNTDSYRPFDVVSTSREFKWSRRSGQPNQTLVPCNISALYTPHHQETLINGVLQGRKQGDLRGMSVVSKRSMWKAVTDLALRLRDAEIAVPVDLAGLTDASCDYGTLKGSGLLAARALVKSEAEKISLKGWVRNVGDSSFSLETAQSEKRKT